MIAGVISSYKPNLDLVQLPNVTPNLTNPALELLVVGVDFTAVAGALDQHAFGEYFEQSFHFFYQPVVHEYHFVQFSELGVQDPRAEGEVEGGG